MRPPLRALARLGLVLSLAGPLAAQQATTAGVPGTPTGPSPLLGGGCAKNVGILGNYQADDIEAFLTGIGNTVVTVDQAFLDGGGLATLDALYYNRGGSPLALANVAAIAAWVDGGGTLVTEFTATQTVLEEFGFCGAGLLAEPFGVPSGTVCGGNDVTVVNPGNPLASGLPASWTCSGDPIGVFLVFDDLDPAFDVVARGPADLNGDGQDDPVVATCCVGSGVWVAFFTDFADFSALQDPRICPQATCARSIEDEILLSNAICLAEGSCVPECFLVIGAGAGAQLFAPDLHTWETQLGGIANSYAVTLENLPVFRVPDELVRNRRRQVAPTLVRTFGVQVVMWNPTVFPGNPEQSSRGLQASLWSDGTVTAQPFGSRDGITLRLETFQAPNGSRYVRFPFAIDGL